MLEAGSLELLLRSNQDCETLLYAMIAAQRQSNPYVFELFEELGGWQQSARSLGIARDLCVCAKDVADRLIGPCIGRSLPFLMLVH
jgi:hypothetical protein